MRYSHRFFLYAPFGLLLLLAAIVIVYWKMTASSFEAWLSKSNGHEIMPGVRISFASNSVGGFPFRLDSVIDTLAFQIETTSSPLVWRTEQFALHMLTYDQSHQVFEAAGKQTLAWRDASSADREIFFLPGSLRASAIKSGGSLARFDADIVTLDTREISADRLQFHIRRAPQQDAFDFVIEGDRLSLDCGAKKNAGAQSVTVAGRITPASPFRSLLAGRAGWQTAYDAWLDKDGKLKVERVDAVAPLPDRHELETCLQNFLQNALFFAGRP